MYKYLTQLQLEVEDLDVIQEVLQFFQPLHRQEEEKVEKEVQLLIQMVDQGEEEVLQLEMEQQEQVILHQ
jgi:hypothetical protein